MRFPLRFCLLTGLTAALLAFEPSAQAVEPLSVQQAEKSTRDRALMNAARRAVAKDDLLKALPLGISVNDKVATIWGNIPSPDLAKRAEALVRKINGIATVMNECRVVPTDPLPQAIAEAVKKARDSNIDPGTSAKQQLPAAPVATTRRIVAKPTSEEVVLNPKGDLNEKVPGVPLLPPPPSVVLLSPVATRETIGNDDWETIRRSEPRFGDLTLQVQAGTVVIGGVVTRMEDAWDLARKLNALPGVKQVILGKVMEK